jgi:hypothetical protein
MPNPALRAYLLQVGPPLAALSTVLAPASAHINSPNFPALHWEIQARGLLSLIAASLTALQAVSDVPQEAVSYHATLRAALNDVQIALERANGALDRQDKCLLAEAHISLQRYLAQSRARNEHFHALIALTQK